VQWALGPAQPRGSQPQQFALLESLGLRSPSAPDATAARLWREKAGIEPVFAVAGRIGASAGFPSVAYGIIRDLANGLKLANAQHAALRLGKASPGRADKLNEAARPRTWSLLSAAEIAAILGWPLAGVPADGLPVTSGHINPVSEQVLVSDERAEGQRVLGESLHPAQRGELVTVPTDTSLHHLHVVGPTGSGKSTLLAGLIAADIAAGRSVFVLEPRGDLVRDVLARVPAGHRDRVVVVEPNSERPVGFNPLAGPVAEAERRADQIVSLLRALHGDAIGPRTADLALHSLTAVARDPEGTLADVPTLLTNSVFRRRVLAKVSDPLVLGPFFAGFDTLSDGERRQVVGPLLNKLRAWLSRTAVRRMLGQAAPRFNLEDLFTDRRVVLVALNEGQLGAEVVNLVGSLMLSQLWNAAQRRAAVPAEQRHPVMVVIDEVQRFLHLPGVELGDFFAQARGLGVSITAAHQHLEQLTVGQRAGILANARSRVVFHPATADAKPLAGALGGSVTSDDLLRLRAYEACAQLVVDNAPTPPFSVRTRPLSPWISDPDELRRASVERYGVDGTALDQALIERWQGGGQSDAPVGARPRRRP
jgi:hypothetical protein